MEKRAKTGKDVIAMGYMEGNLDVAKCDIENQKELVHGR
jgi:hypothetical protein